MKNLKEEFPEEFNLHGLRQEDLESDNQQIARNQPKPGLRIRKPLPKRKLIQLLLAFWIFGICNNVGYVIILSAARDLLTRIDKSSIKLEKLKEEYLRECTVFGTGAILLADTIPHTLVKLVVPFLPLMVHVRIFFVILLSFIGFLLAGFGFDDEEKTHWLIIIGVISVSCSTGLGESTLLAYTVFFPTNNVLSTWSSGTGTAGVIGAVLYQIFKSTKISTRKACYIMLIWPLLFALTFWGLVTHPHIKRAPRHDSKPLIATEMEIRNKIPYVEDTHSIAGKVKIAQEIILLYSIPYSICFLIEYLINQTLFEVLYFPSEIYTLSDQYTWYQTVYQIGVFLSRSSMNVVEVNNLWLLTFLQLINLIILFLEVFFGFLYFVVVCFLCIFWEGIIAGTSYVNTYRRIITEVPPFQRESSMSFNSFSDAIMITVSGLISIPLHALICRTKNPYTKDIT